MGHRNKNRNKFIVLFIGIFHALSCMELGAQPFVEIAGINHQVLSTTDKAGENPTRVHNSFLGLMAPVVLDTSNVLLFRINAERLSVDVEGRAESPYSLSSGLLGFGWQHRFKPSFNLTGLLLFKASSDFNDPLSHRDFQYGVSLLGQYRLGPGCWLKLGFYYNREPFGNFFVPLAGLDWQVNSKYLMYGTLPLGYRFERIISPKIHGGIGLRFFGRSFRLGSSHNHDYVWNQENQFKLFSDYYFYKNFVIFAELGRTLNYGPLQFQDKADRKGDFRPGSLFSPLKDGFFINGGMALRIPKAL